MTFATSASPESS